jgi:hypothetical protein
VEAHNIQDLVNGRFEVSAAPTASADVTLSGLTVGLSYIVEYWAVDIDGGHGLTVLSDPVTLDTNVGQYVIGTFVADATRETFTYSSVLLTSGNGELTAIQLRQGVLETVPEPSTMVLAGFGVFGMLFAAGRRLRSKRAA